MSQQLQFCTLPVTGDSCVLLLGVCQLIAITSSDNPTVT